LSTHNELQFRAALEEPIDYIALGPIFATSSKLNPDPLVGTAELARLAGSSARPVVAIGGISRVNAPEVWRAGAASVAIIGDLYPAHPIKTSVRARAEEWIKIANEHCG
jgi:thiamine-phosphate pyrophosphorylase